MGGAAFCAVLAFPLFVLINTRITGTALMSLVVLYAAKETYRRRLSGARPAASAMMDG